MGSMFPQTPSLLWGWLQQRQKGDIGHIFQTIKICHLVRHWEKRERVLFWKTQPPWLPCRSTSCKMGIIFATHSCGNDLATMSEALVAQTSLLIKIGYYYSISTLFFLQYVGQEISNRDCLQQIELHLVWNNGISWRERGRSCLKETAGETEAECVSLGPCWAAKISKPQGKKLRSSLGFSARYHAPTGSIILRARKKK